MTDSVQGPKYVADSRLWRLVARGALMGVLLGAAILVAGRLLHENPSPVIVLGIPVLGMVLAQLLRASIADPPPPAPQPIRGLRTEEYFLKLRQLERRLDGATRDPAEFEWNIRPLLAELAVDRLHHKHGIRFRSEPDRARPIVGEQLWQVLTTAASRQPARVSERYLQELVQAIQRI